MNVLRSYQSSMNQLKIKPELKIIDQLKIKPST